MSRLPSGNPRRRVDPLLASPSDLADMIARIGADLLGLAQPTNTLGLAVIVLKPAGSPGTEQSNLGLSSNISISNLQEILGEIAAETDITLDAGVSVQ